jgi:phosphoglycolate phosphatase-like HAD superfamily hydrolase
MLILFDIDGTLLLAQGLGTTAMAATGRAMFGPDFSLDGVDIAGRIDPQIFTDAALANGVSDPEVHHRDFRTSYTQTLGEHLLAHDGGIVLPGVEALLDTLEAHDDVTLGILTGNYPESGRLKILAAEIDPARFEVSAWGSDGAHRRDLPAVAMARYESRHGRPITPEQVVIIGDTPHDVDCARASGCRVLAVATGPSYTYEDLAATEPDLLLADLSDTDAVVEWILR